MKANLFVVVMSLVLGVNAMAESGNAKHDDANFCRLFTEKGFQFVGQFYRAGDGSIQVQTADEVKAKASRALGSAKGVPQLSAALSTGQFSVSEVTRSGHGLDLYIVVNGPQLTVGGSYWASGGLCAQVITLKAGPKATLTSLPAAEILNMANENRDLLPISN